MQIRPYADCSTKPIITLQSWTFHCGQKHGVLQCVAGCCEARLVAAGQAAEATWGGFRLDFHVVLCSYLCYFSLICVVTLLLLSNCD